MVSWIIGGNVVWIVGLRDAGKKTPMASPKKTPIAAAVADLQFEVGI
jgi:hypothetical protein